MPAPTPSLLAYLPIDLRIAAARSWSLAKRSAMISALVLAPFLGYACIVQSSSATSGAPGWLTILVVTIVLDLFYAAAIALTVAVLSALWRLFGVALIVATLLAPVAFFGVLALCGPWIVDLGDQVLSQWATAIAAHDFATDPSLTLGSFGHAGHAGVLILLIILLPYVLIWAGQAALLLLTPPVLGSLLSLAAASALVLCVSSVLAIFVAAPLLIVALLRRLRRRHRDYVASVASVALQPRVAA